MSFRLYPVPETKLSCVTALIEQAHSEMDMPALATLDQAKRSLEAGYANKTLAAYVDNLQAPKHLLILSAFPGLLIEGLVVIVHLIYSSPDARGDAEALKVLHSTVENFARFKGAGSIIGSSCIYGNSRPIDPMWKSQGYKQWETVYIKELT
jgi:hypothetical protein